MRTVTTVQFGWSAKSLMQRHAAHWVEANPGLYLTARLIFWLFRKPLVTMGLVLSLWLFMHGLPLLLAFGLGGIPQTLWAARAWYRILTPLTGSGGTNSSSSFVHSPSWRSKVRRNIGNMFASIMRWRVLRRAWPVAAFNAGLVSKQDRERVPELIGVHRTGSGLAAVVSCGSVGMPADQLANKAEVVAASVRGCRNVLVTPGVTPGVANMHFMWADPLGEIFGLDQLPVAPQSSRLSFGITEDGKAATVAKIKSLLIVGQSGSGKSNAMWTLLASAIADGVPFRLRVIDPMGGVELSVLEDSPLVREYAIWGKESNTLIANAHRDMKARLERMKGSKARLHKPTPEEPWEIILIDELLTMKHRLSKAAEAQLQEILSGGRKAAFTVWGLTQLSAVADVGEYRKLFVQKLVLATDSRQMTDNVLGDGAEHAGARCSKIRESTPGIGYASLEGTYGYPRFRVAYVPDEITQMIARGMIPPSMPIRDESEPIDALENQHHIMYGFYAPDESPLEYPDWESQELLYVGVSNRGERRIAEHKDVKKWVNTKGVTWKVLDEFDTRSDALAAEKAMIEQDRPRYNKKHNPDWELRRGK